MKIEGKVFEIMESVAINDNFTKRDFVIETESSFQDKVYKNQIILQLANDKCSIIDNFRVGESVIVDFDLRGKPWEKEGRSGYYNTLNAYKINKAEQSAAAPAQPAANSDNTEGDQLPF